MSSPRMGPASLLLLLALAASLGCATADPRGATGVDAALRAPTSQEALDRAQEIEWKLYYQKVRFLSAGDSRFRKLQAITDRIVAASAKPDEPITVRLMNDEVANAYATGGSYLYVTTALHDEALSDDELALVLAHEVAHIHADHVRRSRGLQLFAETVEGIVNLVGATVDKDAAQLGAVLFTRYGGLVPIKFDRDLESEADAIGTAYMIRAGYDPARAREFHLRMGGWYLAQKEKSATAGPNGTGLTKAQQSAVIRARLTCRLAASAAERRNCKQQTAAVLRETQLRQLELTEAELLYHWGSTHPDTQTRLRVVDTTAQAEQGGTIPDDAPRSVRKVLGALQHLEGPTASASSVISIASVQRALNREGYDCGPPDGVLGDQTRACIRKFQSGQQLPVTGEPDEETRKKLDVLGS